jgi:hypothetical protein
MKKIWLINQYAMPPQYESRIQTLKRAQYLKEFGYDVTIISGSYLHNTDINLINDNRNYTNVDYDGIKFIHIKTCNYRGNGLKRIFNNLEFPIRLFHTAKYFDKPDIIVHTATVPFGNLLYYLAKKIRAKYVVEVLDLWPESFVAFGVISKNNPALIFAYWAERWLYKKADSLVFSVEGGKEYIRDKKWDTDSGGVVELNKVHYINNGVDLYDFEKNKYLYKINDIDLENENIFKVTYLGSIRLANDLKQLIDAAELLVNYKNIQFLIYGDGDDRSFLEDYCKSNNIVNVKFKQKWIDPKYVPYVLSKSSLNILNYKKNTLTKYGGSQSKSFQYMASGKPICANIKRNYCPITKYNIGIAKDYENADEYANAILLFACLPLGEYAELCKNARNAAEEYDYKKLTSDFEIILKKILKNEV